MHVLWVSALCALAWTQAVSPPSTSSTSPQVPEGTIKIEGSEHPEQIPDHWVWRAAFLKLATFKQEGQEASLESVLPLSEADAKVIYKEASLQLRRDDECLRAIQAKQTELSESRASPDASQRALDELTIECRVKDLDAADRVLDALSEEGRTSLQAWLERKRRGMTAFVPSRDRETFRLPR